MEDEERALAGEVKAALEVRPKHSAAGTKWQAQIEPTTFTEIVDAAGLAKAAGKRFIEIVKVQITEARRVLGAEVLDRFTRQVDTVKLTLHRLFEAAKR
jgi:hypothetical protein